MKCAKSTVHCPHRMWIFVINLNDLQNLLMFKSKKLLLLLLQSKRSSESSRLLIVMLHLANCNLKFWEEGEYFVPEKFCKMILLFKKLFVLQNSSDSRLFSDFIYNLKSFFSPKTQIYILQKSLNKNIFSQCIKYILRSKKYNYLGRWITFNTANWIIILMNRFSKQFLIIHSFILFLTLLFVEFIESTYLYRILLGFIRN